MNGSLRGVIFDMDGTLTVPAIDFAEMRRRLGVLEGDILATVKCWPEERQREAFRIIEEIEARARDRLEIQPGARELIAFLDSRRIPKGIITRNTARPARFFMERLGTVFSGIVTREFDRPLKPEPDAALHIAATWGIPPDQILVVGDYRDDILCGRAAGMKTCLLRNERNREHANLADYAVDSLFQLRDLLRDLLDG